MSLFSVLQMTSNSLQANQIGLQVVSQNISNANTPGYSREEVNFQAAPTQKFGGVLLGLGVQVQGVVQVIDQFLNERVRGAAADRAGGEAQETAYQQLEGVLGVLDDSNVNNSLTRFFNSISDILNQPESVSARNLAMLNGKSLAQDVRNLSKRVSDLSTDINSQIKSAVVDANKLIAEITKLNGRIAALEGGSTSKSDAVGLRDQRDQALQNLAELISIRVEEQESSSVNVFVGGEFLVFEGQSRPLAAQTTIVDGEEKVDVVFADTRSSVTQNGGKIAGLLAARDQVLGAFNAKLDDFAKNFIFEFNKIFSSGQGLTGYQSLTSLNAVSDADAPLDAAGLAFTPTSGGFDVLIKNTQTGLTQTTHVDIDLNGLNNDDTTLNKLRDALNAIDGLSASVNSAGELILQTTASNQQFTFANDTSGVLAALGINTFFTGSTAADLNVNANIVNDPRRFAAASSGLGADTDIAAQLAGFLDKPLAALGGETIGQRRDRLIGEVSEASSATQAVTDGFRAYEGALRGQQLAVSGVNIDEETVKLMQFQRAFQASARFISVINEMLDTLVKL